AFHVPLRGALGYYEWSSSRWDALQRVRCDAFPSLHTAMATLGALYALRHRRVPSEIPLLSRAPRWLLPALVVPPALLLAFATIYLRYHYLVDVLAGFVLAVAVAYAAWRGRRWLAVSG